MKPAALRFLVVEDHGFQRKALLQMLARLGAAELLEAADGDAALRILGTGERRVDIVISDLDMPGMDGLEFIRRVGALPAAPAIVALSAMDSSVLAAVENMAGAYGIPLLGGLTKPLAPEQLLALLARYVPPADSAPAAAAAPAAALADIRSGLERGEFEPFFQPKVELAGGRVEGFEALARWRHPEAGWLAPQVFLEAMEENGLVDALTDTMLQQSAAWCRQWRARGLDLSVSVNLSVRSLADLGLADRLTAIVLQAELDPRHVVLEITESTAASGHLGAALENLARLRLKGFGLSIDDFGTGYSSVQQLGRIAFTELKIDRSFVRDAPARESARIILQSSLEMARRLRLVSVAEGVEHAAQWRLLRDLGCQLAQGYLVAAPMEAARVPAWIALWNGHRGATAGAGAAPGEAARGER